MAFSCFTELMKRMNHNFPHGGAMDTHFANMRSLIQILDSELFELMHQNGDYTHFYFCYRWFLLDFKRELVYDDVFSVWETIWAAKHTSSTHFVLFIALAMVEMYRDIILENNMDFTDIIKFFNVSQDLMEQGAALWHPTARKSSCSSCSQNGSSDAVPPNGCNHERAPLKMLCDNMKYQIISRAFYGCTSRI
ncbi:Small G protein signaling modulator 1 [Acipenser ruthenus]|uniref:Small G protein signaling modulator 1 n=1 Tax=Acipenser ruthenus TaxID=7906 RepID=A0A444URM5_ACIRT|nr:Small G protein signaling modulator 1 [Acipenser ruthenus]